MPSRRRRAVTGRAIVLGALVVLLLVVLAAPLNRYFGSRSDLGSAAQQLQHDQQQLAQLREAQQQWSDPGYIQQQARERLQYAMPGDTVYVVVGSNGGSQSRIEQSVAKPTAAPTPGSWNGRLWASVEQASK